MEAGAQLSNDSSVEIRLNARSHALCRCLTNLIDNALKYGVIEVVIAIDVLRTEVIIGVRAHGPGIPMDEIDKVFEPFYRIESSHSRDTCGPVWAWRSLARLRLLMAAKSFWQIEQNGDSNLNCDCHGATASAQD